MRLSAITLIVLVLIFSSCNKEKKIHNSFRYRIGNTYKNVNGSDDVIVVFEKKKLKVYTNGVRTYTAGYLFSTSELFNNDMLYEVDGVSYLRFDYKSKEDTELTIYLSSDNFYGKIGNEDIVRFGYGYSSVDAIILKKI